MNLEIEIKQEDDIEYFDIHRGFDGFDDDDKENETKTDLENVESNCIEVYENDDHGNNIRTNRLPFKKEMRIFNVKSVGSYYLVKYL